MFFQWVYWQCEARTDAFYEGSNGLWQGYEQAVNEEYSYQILRLRGRV